MRLPDLRLPDRNTVDRARTDVGVFARVLVGEELWRHQLEVVRSPARIRAICSGRQAGKSRTLSILALHTAYATAGARVLILSAGEDVAKELLASIAALAQAPMLAGSVLDENSGRLSLSNGSEIISVPASTKQVRGRSIDLLILDEAAFMDEELWTAARYTVVARPGSKIVMASTPFGRADRFFAVTYRAGLARNRVEGYESFHWPSTASPLVDKELLKGWRSTSTDREYRREVLAEWVDDQGAYFTSEELDTACCDYPLTPPEQARGRPAVAGVDWGFSADANAVALLSVDEVLTLERGTDGPVYAVPWVEEAFRTPYATFIDRVVEIGDNPSRYGERSVYIFSRRHGYNLHTVVSEMNGVGGMPTQELTQRLRERALPGNVLGVHTDARLKENAFGTLKMWMQQGRLALPRHPALLRQLAALEFETTEAGTVRIAVPDRAGHDDLVMALCLATHHQASIDRRGPAQVMYQHMGGRR
ncbi:MAG: terminase family protein [Actinomycetota bacterium]|nr:terminase family protein [Actinomycetota bacterium]